MINATEKFKEEVQYGKRYFVCYAAITLKDGTVLELDNSNIWDGGFKFEEATSSSGSFDIGAVVIGKFTLLINNMTDEFSQYDFTDANVNMRIGLQFSDGTQEVFQKGVCTVDEADYNGAIISLSCLDNISKFEKPYSEIQTTYPATLGDIVRDICFERGVTLDTPEFSNHEYVVESRPDGEELTDLAVLSYVAQIAGCWGKCSPSGGFGLYWYNETSSVISTIDGGEFGNEPINAYDGGEFGNEPTETVDSGDFTNNTVLEENAEDEAHRIYSISSMKVCTDDVVITGITVEGEEQSATFGTEGYVLKISKNPFILEGQEQTVADYLGAKIVGMMFRPLTVSALSDPSIEAGDSAYVIDAKGNSYATYLTSVSFGVGSYENFVCDAKTPSRNNATQYKASTENIVAARKEAEKIVSKYDKYVEQMTNLISQGSGMYKTDVVQEDGTIITYMHDKPTIEESGYIGYWTSNGIMASKDGGLTFAIDANGNALLNTLMLKGISADWLKTGSIEVKDKDGNIRFSVNIDTNEVYLNGEYVTIGGQSIREAIDEAIIQSNEEPDETTRMWLDTSQQPPVLKQWNGETWVVVGQDYLDEIAAVSQKIDTSIKQTQDAILSTVSEQYYKKGAEDDPIAIMESRVEQSSNALSVEIKSLQQDLSSTNDTANNAEKKVTEISNYLRYVVDENGVGTVELGTSESPIILKQRYNKLYFEANGSEVMYIEVYDDLASRLFITDGEFLGELKIGNLALRRHPADNGIVVKKVV